MNSILFAAALVLVAAGPRTPGVRVTSDVLTFELPEGFHPARKVQFDTIVHVGVGDRGREVSVVEGRPDSTPCVKGTMPEASIGRTAAGLASCTVTSIVRKPDGPVAVAMVFIETRVSLVTVAAVTSDERDAAKLASYVADSIRVIESARPIRSVYDERMIGCFEYLSSVLDTHKVVRRCFRRDGTFGNSIGVTVNLRDAVGDPDGGGIGAVEDGGRWAFSGTVLVLEFEGGDAAAYDIRFGDNGNFLEDGRKLWSYVGPELDDEDDDE
jgi:hypothetical protein